MRVRPARFTVGTWVLYYNSRRHQGRSPKWQLMYTGPFLVTRMLDPVNVVLQRGKKAKPFVSHVDKLKRCYGVTPESWLNLTDVSHVEFDAREEDEISPRTNHHDEGTDRVDEVTDDGNAWAGELPNTSARRSGRTVRRPTRLIESC